MRFAMAQPCLGSSESVLRIKRSSVPWTRSFGFAILWLSTMIIVDCQGMRGRQVCVGQAQLPLSLTPTRAIQIGPPSTGTVEPQCLGRRVGASPEIVVNDLTIAGKYLPVVRAMTKQPTY